MTRRARVTTPPSQSEMVMTAKEVVMYRI
jgi:hypothetical protein